MSDNDTTVIMHFIKSTGSAGSRFILSQLVFTDVILNFVVVVAEPHIVQDA